MFPLNVKIEFLGKTSVSDSHDYIYRYSNGLLIKNNVRILTIKVSMKLSQLYEKYHAQKWYQTSREKKVSMSIKK